MYQPLWLYASDSLPVSYSTSFSWSKNSLYVIVAQIHIIFDIARPLFNKFSLVKLLPDQWRRQHKPFVFFREYMENLV